MKAIQINIHSIVDIITNSSTEIYIAADNSTITTIQELVDNLLSTAGSDLKSTDLFTFELEVPDRYYDSVQDSRCYGCEEFEACELRKGAEAIQKCEHVPSFEEWKENNYDDQYDRGVIVTAKREECKVSAKILSNLSGLFSIEEGYS